MKDQVGQESINEIKEKAKCKELLMEIGDTNIKLRFPEETQDSIVSEVKTMMLFGYLDASLG